MSTTDRVTIYNKPCPCQKGTITITECSPDHPYVRDSQTWYEGHIHCKKCSIHYKIDEKINSSGRTIILVRKEDAENFIPLIDIDMFCRGLR